MDKVIKQIHSQDAGFKLSPKKSGETSLNLSNVILNFLVDSRPLKYPFPANSQYING